MTPAEWDEWMRLNGSDTHNHNGTRLRATVTINHSYIVNQQRQHVHPRDVHLATVAATHLCLSLLLIARVGPQRQLAVAVTLHVTFFHSRATCSKEV